MQFYSENANPSDFAIARLHQQSRGAFFFKVAAVVVVTVYISNLHGYLYTVGDAFKLLHYQLAVIGLAAIALIVRHEAILHRLPSALIIWIGLFLILIFSSFLSSAQTQASVDQMIFGLRAGVLLFSFTVLLVPEYRSKEVLYALVFCVLLAVGLHVYDFLNPTFSSNFGRAAGFHQNSNASGKVVAIAMVLSCVVLPKPIRLVYCVIAGIAVLITFSRSAMLLWVIGIIGLAATGNLVFRSKVAAVIVFGGLGLLTILAIVSGSMLDAFQAVGLDKYLTTGTLSRLGGDAAELQDASAAGRINVLWHSLAEFQKHPWFGSGLGATSEWISLQRPHNLYLMLAVEAGIFGLLVFLALIATLWFHTNAVGRVAVVMYAVSSFFTHNNLEHPATLCLLAIMIALYPRTDTMLAR